IPDRPRRARAVYQRKHRHGSVGDESRAHRAAQRKPDCCGRADPCEQAGHGWYGHSGVAACANTVGLETLRHRPLRSAMSSEVEQRATRIKLLLMDCDGVLTDGRIWLFENGEEQKGFHTRDGLGIELWHRAGLKSGIISGRKSSAVEARARGLGMSFVRQGCEDKQGAFADTLALAEVTNEEVAF